MATPSSKPTLFEPCYTVDNQDVSTRGQVQTPRSASPPQGSIMSDSTAVHSHFDRLRPAWDTKRYERTKKLEPPFLDLELDAITTSFADSNEPDDWTRIAHPEGALYWVFEHKQGGKAMRIYTDAYLCDVEIREEIERFRDAILDRIEEKHMPAEWELVLDLADGDPHECTCGYYFVNHLNRTLFWLHRLHISEFLKGGIKVKSKRRIQQALEEYYWTHWEMFPHDREVPEKLLKELIGIMTHAGIDDMTTSTSTSPYSVDQLEQLISYAERVRLVGGDGGYSACVVGRLMEFFTYARFLNFFGEREARLDIDQSVFSDQDRAKRTLLIKCASLLLFFAPESHLKALNVLYTDTVTSQHRWNEFINKKLNEWRELVRIGIVILIANIVFLAISSFESLSGAFSTDIGAESRPRNLAQVIGFISIVFSLGCVIIGHLLLRHHTIRRRTSAEAASQYLRSHFGTLCGFEALAILYSLPRALLLWAITSFSAAFVFVAIVDSAGKWQRWPTLAVAAVFFVLLLWCVYMTWEGKEESAESAGDPSGRRSAPKRTRNELLRPKNGEWDSQDSIQLKSIVAV